MEKLDQSNKTSILEAAKEKVEDLFKTKVGSQYVYHNFEHVQEVVEAAHLIASHYNLAPDHLESLLLAAWFHDTGYVEGPNGHEERGALLAQEFMKGFGCTEAQIETVKACIMATKWPQNPQSLLEKIMCDADLSHLGSKMYWDKSAKVKQELLLTQNRIPSEQEWVDFELDFITNHQYHTHIAQELYDKRKQKQIKILKKHKLRLHPETVDIADDIEDWEKKKEKKEKKLKQNLASSEFDIKTIDLGRGVETMYRNIYRTHLNLSSIADNKANIMLSINAIIVSIVISSLVPKFGTDSRLIIPTLILLVICLVALVFAILATRPQVTEGKFSRKDIENKTANLLFFGNFYNMKLEDFHWGMMEMIKDSDFLYSSMTRDLFYLGVVLARKYRFLSYCYNIFMIGLIVSVTVFAISFILG